MRNLLKGCLLCLVILFFVGWDSHDPSPPKKAGRRLQNVLFVKLNIEP